MGWCRNKINLVQNQIQLPKSFGAEKKPSWCEKKIILVQKREKPAGPVWCRKKIFWCRNRSLPVLNDPYKHATSPILFCTINSVFSAIISGKLFLSVNITSESCLHEKSPVVFKILVLSRALLGAGPGRAVAPHHGDRDTHTHQPPPSMAIMLQNKHHAISIHFCPSFNHLSHIFS